MITKKIEKKHYSFKPGYMQIQLAQKAQLKAELCEAIGARSKHQFSYRLHNGYTDPRLSIVTNVEVVMRKYNITDRIWEITEVAQ